MKDLQVNRAKEITRLHGEIIDRLKTSLKKAIRIGKLLTEQKSALKHGEFLPWVAANLPFTDRTARNYMRLYRERDRLKSETVSDLNSAIKLLKKPKRKVNQITDEMESVFAHAVALNQSGRLKNTIHCSGNVVYILNTDHTVLLRFELENTTFENEISFTANDYDSSEFYEQDNQIVFVQRAGNMVREKYVGIPYVTFSDAEKIFAKFNVRDLLTNSVKITMTKSEAYLTDDKLSHVKFTIENGEPVLIQYDIYTGAVDKIKMTTWEAKKLFDFEIGMRTKDLRALFSFNNTIDIYVPQGQDFFMVQGSWESMKAVIAGCLYDESGEIGTIEVKQ